MRGKRAISQAYLLSNLLCSQRLHSIHVSLFFDVGKTHVDLALLHCAFQLYVWKVELLALLSRLYSLLKSMVVWCFVNGSKFGALALGKYLRDVDLVAKLANLLWRPTMISSSFETQDVCLGLNFTKSRRDPIWRTTLMLPGDLIAIIFLRRNLEQSLMNSKWPIMLGRQWRCVDGGYVELFQLGLDSLVFLCLLIKPRLVWLATTL